MTQGYEFRIQTETRFAATLAEVLTDSGKVVPHPTCTVNLELLDSFDWRLFRAGSFARVEHQKNVATLICRATSRSRHALTLGVDRSPRFWKDLGDGPVRRRLARSLGVRVLIPRVTLSNRRRLYQVLDGENKTVVRLYWERLSLNRDRKTLSLLRVEPLRGYEKAAAELARRLAKSAAVAALDTPWEIEVYRWAGLVPGDYESKLKLALQPQMRSDAALRSLLNHLTEMLELNAPGMRRAIDTEFLHDYRVAVRRIRSALSQLKEILPRRTRERFRREFAWLGEITGPARDLDVYLLNFDHYLSLLPPHMASDLEPLRAFLVERQRQAYADIIRHLDSARYRRLLAAWRHYLATPLPAHSRLPDARRPIKTVADARIWSAYRKVIKRGRRIDDRSPSQDLHQLRIRCKRLRYLLEFFRSLYPKRRIGRAIDALKGLQDVLGEFQDLDVQQHALRHFGEQMIPDHSARHPTYLALAELVARLEAQQHEVRAHFAKRFRHFSAAHQRAEFAALFHSSPASDA